MRSAGIIDWDGIVAKAQLIKDWCDRDRAGKYKLNMNGTFQLINILNVKDFIEFIIKFYGWDTLEPSTASKERHSFEHRILVGPKMFKADWATIRLVEESIQQIEYLQQTYPFFTRITERRYLNDIKTLLLKIKNEPQQDAEKYRKNFVEFTNAIDKIRSESIAVVAPGVYEELFK